MILQAVRTDTAKCIASATCLGALAADVAKLLRPQTFRPRIAVYRAVNGDRWNQWEMERELAALLLRDHDMATEPIAIRIAETARWLAHNEPGLDSDRVAARVARSFGLKKMGKSTTDLAWKAYCPPCNP